MPVWIDGFWDTVEFLIENLNLPYERVVIYQDSYFGDIISRKTWFALAGEGSRNAQLLLKLKHKGASLRPTESEVRHLADGFFGRFLLGSKTLAWRDRYIANQINNTLKKEEIGLLFLGAGHEEFALGLDPDIELKNFFA
ncbi:MAG: hypothetical protein Q8R36_03170 [bacterium]|nr:hypothetical protein [bacterium]